MNLWIALKAFKKPEETGNPEIGRGDFDAEGDATRKIGRMKVGCLESS